MKSLKNMKKTLNHFLAGYSSNFTKDLDEIWKKYDTEENGYLDKVQTRAFLDEIA